jgi:hypothetical protein
MEGQVKIGKEFFEKIRLDYQDWRWALVREFMQNCMDAPRSSEIKVSVAKVHNGTLLTVSNNGEPMTKDVLLGKLLTLGGSGKNFEGGVGGFGVAKSLLYYTHESYVIRTGSLRVEGEGAQYTISECKPINGTASEVVVAGNEVENLRKMVRRFAAMAQWKGGLHLDGEKLTCDLKKGARRKDLGWGVVYTNHSFKNLCIVRLNGQPMFTTFARFDGCVLIELSGQSGAVLTSNRDGLKWSYKAELEDLLTSLAVDKKSALKEEKAEYKRWKGEQQKIEAKKPKVGDGGLAAALGISLVEVVKGAEVESTKTPAEEAAVAQPVPETAIGGGIKTIAVSREEETSVSIGPEFILKNVTGRKVPLAYQPGEKFSEYSRELARAWVSILVRLHSLLNVSGNFSIGFLFDDEVLAEHEQSAAYGKVYYINPAKLVENNGKTHFERRYDSAWKDRHSLISSAAHEVVHGAYGLKQHDENYAGRLTTVMETCLKEVKSLEEVCRKKPSETAGTGQKFKVVHILGHPMTAVVRWMGGHGWTFNEACGVLECLKVEMAESTMRQQLLAGSGKSSRDRGPHAPLTEEQIEELESIRANWKGE